MTIPADNAAPTRAAFLRSQRGSEMNIDPWNPDARRARIKAIKAIAGKKGLALDDDAYRAMIGAVVPGKRSAGDCNVQQLEAVLEHLKRLQAGAPAQRVNPRDSWEFVFRCTPERQLYLRRIYRLAERVGGTLAPPAPIASKAYVEGVARQMIQCDTALEFCGPELLHKIVQALEVYCRRHEV